MVSNKCSRDLVCPVHEMHLMNSFLSLKFDGHINIEFLESVVSVKYIYKYITKGTDRCIISTKTSTESEQVGVKQVNEVETVHTITDFVKTKKSN